MSATPEQEANIQRLHRGEHWPVGTIATQLAVHADVVRRVLGLDEARTPLPPRSRLVDPYVDFITATLKQYPTLRATRLHDMVKPRGFTGAVRTLTASRPAGAARNRTSPGWFPGLPCADPAAMVAVVNG